MAASVRQVELRTILRPPKNQWCKAIVVCRVSEITSQVKSSPPKSKTSRPTPPPFISLWPAASPAALARGQSCPGRLTCVLLPEC